MKKRLSELFGFVLLFAVICFSEEVDRPFVLLKGVLPEVLSSGDKPYFVTGDILVSPGTVVTIEAGAVLLFKEFTGLHVDGTLHVNGTDDQPVVFTSKNDTAWNKLSSVNPAPFDWAGIEIQEGAVEATFSGAEIKYSVFGIQSHIDSIRLENCIMTKNGKSDLSIKGLKKDGEKLRFNYRPIEEKPVVVVTKPTVAPVVKPDVKPELIQVTHERKKKSSVGKNILRYCGLTVGVGGAGLASYFYTKYLDSNDKFNEISILSKENLQKYTSEDWDSAKKARIKDMTLIGVSGGIAVLGLASFGISFAF